MKNPRTIVISGASSGIGAALAVHYAAPGVSLHLLGRSEARLAEVAGICHSRGASVECGSIDVRDHLSMESWLQELDAKTPVDLVIANAGISGGSGGTSVTGEDPAQLRRIMSVNVDGVINTITPLMDRMVSRKRGQIAIVSSLAGLRGLPSAPAYSTSKAAVKTYGEGLRGWLGKHGVEVSVILPGYIRTPLTSHNTFPMPFLMEPEKAAAIIARGLEKNRSRIAFPRRMYYPVLLVSMLPMWLTDPVFSRLPSKPALND
jgi:short-subunit dehydrogenase